MSISFCLTRAELEKGLKLLDDAAKGGFHASVAVFYMSQAGRSLDECVATSDASILLKAHPTDPDQDWGRCTNPGDYILVDGKPVYHQRPKEPQ